MSEHALWSPIRRAAQVVLAVVQLQHRHRAPRQLVAIARAQAPAWQPRVRGVEQRVPPLDWCGRRQDERHRGGAAVEDQQQRVADDPLAALVDFLDRVAVEPDAERAHVGGVPHLVGHLLPGGIEPRDVEYVGAANTAPLEELAATQYRVVFPEADDAPR